MGFCFSRMSSRVGNIEDLNTCGLQFIGGEGCDFDGCPSDKVSLAFGAEKDLAETLKVDGLKCACEDTAKKIYTATWKATKAKLEELEKKFDDVADHKKKFVGGKYSAEDAIAHLKGCLKEWEEHADIKVEGEGEKTEEKPDEMADEMMMEGGDDMEGMEEMGMMSMEDAVKNDPYADDSFAFYKGWENLPALYLRSSVAYPYFGDLCKAAMLKQEFEYKKGAEVIDFGGAAALMGVAVDAAETADGETWFAGYAGEHDFASLKEMVEAKGAINFPGILAGWETKELAVENWIKYADGKQQELFPVIYHVKSKFVKAVVVR